MKAYQNGDEILFAEAETPDEAQVSGRWIRGKPVEVEP